jgi:hypothetical protein
VLRDDQTRFAGVIRTTGVRAGDYVSGRFFGGFLATCLCFLTVPAGLIAGSAAPGLDPAAVGPCQEDVRPDQFREARRQQAMGEFSAAGRPGLAPGAPKPLIDGGQ